MRLTALVLGSALTAAAAPALACSCLPPASAAAQLESADVMFKGTPIRSTSSPRGDATTTFRVQDVLKGRPAREITIRHRLDSAACGVRFRPRASVLVIANQGEGGALRASLCTAPKAKNCARKRPRRCGNCNVPTNRSSPNNSAIAWCSNGKPRPSGPVTVS